jgi:hypothetical protein
MATVLIGASSAASAVPMTWIDYIDFNPDPRVNDEHSLSYIHNIVDNGYTPIFDLVYNASLQVDLYDDRDKEGETAKIDVPGFFGKGDRTYFDLSGTEFGGWSLLGYAQLWLTGTYEVVITAITGDFKVGSSLLVVNGEDLTNVPEPTTLGLLGLGLLGVAGVSRKRKQV